MELEIKYKEMVAIGAAVASNCLPCLQYHYKKCLELGFSHQEVQEAIAMANKVKSVPAEKINDVAQKLASKNE